ncbi:hypothetical protein AAE478_007599 [Parahypoxylon ruwenzoriense]
MSAQVPNTTTAANQVSKETVADNVAQQNTAAAECPCDAECKETCESNCECPTEGEAPKGNGVNTSTKGRLFAAANAGLIIGTALMMVPMMITPKEP